MASRVAGEMSRSHLTEFQSVTSLEGDGLREVTLLTTQPQHHLLCDCRLTAHFACVSVSIRGESNKQLATEAAITVLPCIARYRPMQYYELSFCPQSIFVFCATIKSDDVCT